MRFTPWDWAGFRVVVVDIETTAKPPSDESAKSVRAEAFRVVEVATVTLKGTRLTSSWSTPVKPPIRVDPTSYAIHRITDDDLDTAATFADIEPHLTRLLAPTADEQVIVVAHKTSFDIPILRAEYLRLGLDIPDTPVIDTLAELPEYVGLERDSRSLSGTAEALNVVHASAHTALGDATATSEVFRKLLDYCIPKGVTNFPTLLDRLDGATTHTVIADLPDLNRDAFDAPAAISAEHRATHDVAATADTLDEWLAGARQCIDYACPLLADKRQAAFDTSQPPLSDLEQLAVLDGLLVHAQSLATTAGPEVGAAGTATALGAFSPLLKRLPSKSEKANSPYTAVRKWGTTWGNAATSIGACREFRCPDCEAGRTCPNEAWPMWLATRLFDVKVRKYRPGKTRPRAHFDTIIKQSIPSERAIPATYPALIRDGLPTVADELLQLACTRLEQDGYMQRANSMRTEAWEYHDARSPHLARWKAARVLGQDPATAIATCIDMLESSDCPPGPARRLLITDLRRYQQFDARRHRDNQIDPDTPSGRAARSRLNPARPATRIFGLD